MHIPKKYGASKVEKCPFCSRQATAMNPQGVPVCKHHKSSSLPELTCLCRESLELKNGKFGIFFNCISCGNISAHKAFEVNDINPSAPVRDTSSSKKTESKPESKTVNVKPEDVFLYCD